MGRDGVAWFVGQVEDVNDPKQLGRVRVRMFGEHSNTQIQTGDLPWATPIMPIVSAAYLGEGVSPTGIKKGSQVFGFNLDGYEGQIPLIWGTYNKMTNGTSDVSPLATGTNTIKKDPTGPEPPSAYAAKYPHNKTLTTASGHAIEIDDTPGAERMHMFHKSGSYVEVNQDGRVVIKAQDDYIEINMGDRTVYCTGDYSLTVQGDLNANVSGDYTLTVAGDYNATIQGNYQVNTDDAEFSGEVTAQSDGDSVGLSTHQHSGVQTGGGDTDPPVGGT